MFGPANSATFDAVDESAPGAPLFTIRQTGNDTGEFILTPPATDANGGKLTGLTFAQCVVLQVTEEEAIALRSDFEAALAMPGAQFFQLDASGGAALPPQEFVVSELNKAYSVIGRCADHAPVQS